MTNPTDREAVKRFDPWRNADGVPHMKAVPNGAWVRWVDYCALLARAMPYDPPLPPDPNDEYIERIKELEAEVAALREGIRVAVNRLEEPWTPVHAGCSTTIRDLADKETT